MPFTLVYPMFERLTIYFNLTEPEGFYGELYDTFYTDFNWNDAIKK